MSARVGSGERVANSWEQVEKKATEYVQLKTTIQESDKRLETLVKNISENRQDKVQAQQDKTQAQQDKTVARQGQAVNLDVICKQLDLIVKKLQTTKGGETLLISGNQYLAQAKSLKEKQAKGENIKVEAETFQKNVMSFVLQYQKVASAK